MKLLYSTELEVKKLAKDNRKIEAIKLIRNELNIGLPEAIKLFETVTGEAVMGSGHFSNSTLINKMPKKMNVRVIWNIMLFLGISFLVTGSVFYYFHYQKIQNSEKVLGLVIDYDSYRSGLAPIVAYQWEGQQQTVVGTVYSRPPAYEIGEQVAVYVPNDSTDLPFLDSFMEAFATPLAFGFLGFVFSLLGFAGRAVKW